MAATTPAPAAATTPPATGVYVATHKAPSNGLTGVVPVGDGTKLPAWEFTFTTEDGTVSTYCIQRGVFVADKAKHNAITWPAAAVPNLGRVANLAVNHTKIGTPYTDVRWKPEPPRLPSGMLPTATTTPPSMTAQPRRRLSWPASKPSSPTTVPW